MRGFADRGCDSAPVVRQLAEITGAAFVFNDLRDFCASAPVCFCASLCERPKT